MKKTLLLLSLLLFAVMQLSAQCDAPSNVQATSRWDQVTLTWHSPLINYTPTDAISYGGDVSIGVGLGDYTFTAAIRLTPDSLIRVSGKYLSHVKFTLWENTISTLTIKVWQGGSYDSINDIFYEGTLVSTTPVDVSTLVSGENMVTLNTPVLVNSTQEIWIGYEVLTSAGNNGFPAAATNTVYDNLNNLWYAGDWMSLATAGIEGFGWIISGCFVQNVLDISGFNVYRDNTLLNTTPITDHFYTDTALVPQTQYCYRVESVCSSTTSSSDTLCFSTTTMPSCGTPIGAGTTTTTNLPFNSFYNYAYSQQIFTAAEMGAQLGTIVSLGLPYMHATPRVYNNIQVYMANIQKTTFNSTTDWVSGDDLTLVYDGPYSCDAADTFSTITFNTPFEWDGTSNVVVAIVYNEGTFYVNEPRFYCHTTSGTTSLYAYRDVSAYNVSTPPSGYLANAHNNIRFCFGPQPNCYAPSHLILSGIRTYSATLSWQPHTPADTLWEVVCVASGQSVNSGTPMLVHDSTCVLTGLDPNTHYDVYLRTVCSSLESSSWVNAHFRTQCEVHQTIPYVETFDNYGSGGEDTYPFCWTRSTNNITQYPYVLSSGQLYLYSYENLYSLAVSQALDLSAYPAGTLALNYLIGITNATYGRLDVGIMTDHNDISTFTLLKSYYPSDFPVVGVFQHDYITLPERYQTPVCLAFYAPAPVSSINNYVNVEDVRVDYVPTCSNPSNLTVSNITGTAATLSWTPAQYGSTGYTIQYGVAGQTPTTVTTTGSQYMLTGLTTNTTYDVKLVSNCIGGSSDTIYANFTTLNFITCLQPNPNPLNLADTTLAETSIFQLPMNTYYNYSYSQQIIPASAINSTQTSNLITGIGFYYDFTTPTYGKNNVKIYLAHRNTATFASASDWTPISEATLVYEGDMNCSQGWNVFDFDTYFSYNGTDNLVVIVDDNSGTYNSSSYVFRGRTLNTYQSLYCYNDNNNPDPADPPTGVLGYIYSDMQLFVCNQVAPLSCPEPMVYINNADDQGVTVTWISNGDETAWALQYKPEGGNNWTSAGFVTSSPYTIRNLSTDTHYDIRLCAICSATDSSAWSYTSAYVPCTPISLPYFEDFDNEAAYQMPSCWTRLYNTSMPMPSVSTSFAASGNKSLYFNCPTANTYAYGILPRFNNLVQMDHLQVQFKAYKTLNAHMVEVGVMTNPADPSTFVLLGTFSPSALNTWEMGEVITDNYDGDGRYLAFRIPRWYANSIYIDDVDVQDLPSCPHVNNINATSIEPTSAIIRWTAGSTETQWAYLYGPEGSVNPAVDTPHYCNVDQLTLNGLIPNTLYSVYVQSYCSATEQSAWLHYSFRTGCATMAQLPYMENFDSYVGTTSSSVNVLPNCWSRINNGNNHAGYPTVYSAAAHTGANCLAFFTHSSSNYADQYAILPEIDTTVLPINTLQLTLSMAAWSSNYPFQVQVGIMSDPMDLTTFTPVQVLSTNSTSYIDQNVYFDIYSGAGKYIALKVAQPASNYNYGYIDDIVLSVIPDCSPVSNLTVSNEAGTSALISWEPGHYGNVTDYTLVYSVEGQNHWDTASHHITGTSYLLSNLQPTTNYNVQVITNCDSSYSNVVSQSFRTSCMAGGDVVIGNGTEHNSYLPCYSFYKFSYSQQIYTATEMGGANVLRSISFNMTNWVQNRTLSIYLMHTTEAASSSWLPAANAQLVFSGAQNMSPGWNTFEFATPFVYDGVHNLAVIVVDETGAYANGSSNTWHVHVSPSGSGASRYTFNDSNPYNINNAPTTSNGGVSDYCNDVVFGGDCDSLVTCIPPNFYVENVTTNSADIVWVSGNSETSWVMEYKKTIDSTWTPVTNLSNYSVHLSNLQPSTSYNVRMLSNCGSTVSSYRTIEFSTECGLISTLPYQESFDIYGSGINAYPHCWGKINTHPSSNMPHITETHYSAPGSLYFYAGSSGTYNAAITPEFDASIAMNTLQVSFMYSANSSADRLVVGVISDPEDIGTFVPVDTVSPSISSATAWTEQYVYLNNYHGNGHHIAFLNAYSNASSYAYVDNLEVKLIPSCLTPREFSALTNSNSVVLSWMEAGTATTWEIEYGAEGFTHGSGTVVTTSTHPFTITGLSAITYDFYVRANCGNNDVSDWVGPIKATPGSYNLPTTGEYSVILCGGHIYDNGGPTEEYDSECDVTLVINPEVAGQLVHLTGTFEVESDYDNLAIYDGSDISGTKLFDSDVDSTLDMVSITGPLTLHFTSDASVQYFGFDILVTCEGGPTPDTCEAPTDLTATPDLSDGSIQLDWNQQGTPDSWTISYKQIDTAPWSTVTTTTHPYTLTGMGSNVEYQVFVVANCGEQTSDESEHISFFIPGVHDYLMSTTKLYPNPTTGKFRIENSELSIQKVEVYDVYGKLMQAVEVNGNVVDLDASAYAAGMYFVRIACEKGIVTKPFIKK